MKQATELLIIDLVDKHIKEGYSPAALLEYLMLDEDQGGYGYGLTMAYKLRKDAYRQIEDMHKEAVIDVFVKQITRLEQQYQKCIRKGNDRLALEYLKEIDKISGLYKDRIEVNSNVTIKTNWGGDNDISESLFE